MRPTRRGYGALVVVATAMLLSWVAGPRSLNAIAGPLLVAVVAGVVQVYRAGEPRVERTTPRNGFPGQERIVELDVAGRGVAEITDAIGGGLSGSATFERTLPTTVIYEVNYEQRGVGTLGPTTVRVRDVLGLVESTYEIDESAEVLVYPNVHAVGDPEAFLEPGPGGTERTEFNRIREYSPGDSLRDVNWKHSAKYDELLVTEFDTPADREGLTIAGGCSAGHDDEMATATATLFVAANRAGLAPTVTVPGGAVSTADGVRHEQRTLELLARTDGGDVPPHEWERADVRVYADGSGVSVGIDDRAFDFEDLTTARVNPLRTEVVA